MSKPILPKGLYVQIYREKIPGNTFKKKLDNLCKELDLYSSIGVVGILAHGFPSELDINKFKEFEQLCDDRGLICIPAFGLNSDNPELKGQKIGAVAAVAKSRILVLDAEGAWEDEKEDKKNAVILGKEIRKLAPDVLICDQPWPIPDVHWSMFPWEEFADYIDISAPQVYVNNWRSKWGKDAYEKFWEWHLRSWSKLETRLIKAGKGKPITIPTIQGYAWMIEDLIDCLCKHDTMFIWSEPFLSNGSKDKTDNTVRGIKAFNELKKRGFVGVDAVSLFQRSTNGKLTVDGVCGEKTLKELGC